MPDTKRHYLADFERNNRRPFPIKSGERPTVDTLGRDNPAGGSVNALPRRGEKTRWGREN
ncbi:MAG: hypothetical protein ACLQA5_03805 [Solirubrobacteraceae bacterium]